jgi:hypothetical protein
MFPTESCDWSRIALSYFLCKKVVKEIGQNQYFYICIVHTVVLFQSLAGIYCQTQHVEY